MISETIRILRRADVYKILDDDSFIDTLPLEIERKAAFAYLLHLRSKFNQL